MVDGRQEEKAGRKVQTAKMIMSIRYQMSKKEEQLHELEEKNLALITGKRTR